MTGDESIVPEVCGVCGGVGYNLILGDHEEHCCLARQALDGVTDTVPLAKKVRNR